jgi:opacity protein-like surface antigen
VYVINKRFKVFPSIGCSANIFTGKTTKTKYILADSSPIKTTQNFQRKNIPSTEFALLLGVGLSYDINKNIFVKLEPSYRTFIRPLIDGPVSGTLYSIGANAGVYFNF